MDKTALRENALRALSILGLVAILLIGAWGIIQIAFGLSDFFGGLGSPAPQNQPAGISLTVPASIISGSPFTLSWTNPSTPGNYSYAVSYSCAAGLTMKAPLPTGAMQEVKCDTPFNYTSATDKLSLTPIVTGGKSVSTTLTVAATQLSTGAVAARATKLATIAPAGSASAPASGSSGASISQSNANAAGKYVSKGSYSSLYGLPDLAVSVLSATPSGSRYTVQFVVQNVGTNRAPAGWTFSANVPASTAYVYPSGPQQALNPGDKIVYTMSFDIPAAQNYYPQQPYYQPYGYSAGYGANYPYANCGYRTNYIYNGIYNYPIPTYSCTPNNTYIPGYGYYSYPSSNYSSYNSYNYPYYNRVFSVTVISTGAESTTANNTASVSI